MIVTANWGLGIAIFSLNISISKIGLYYLLKVLFLSDRYFHCSEGENEVDSQDYSRDDGDNSESKTDLEC